MMAGAGRQGRKEEDQGFRVYVISLEYQEVGNAAGP